MSLENDITKARILLAQAERARAKAQIIRDDKTKVADDEYQPFDDRHTEARFRLQSALEANGQCPTCEKPIAECTGYPCGIALAPTPVDASAVQK